MHIKIPRGIRLSNPGNIKKSKSEEKKWEGEILPGRDDKFATFEMPLYGLRAMMRLLINYQRKYGINTIAKAIRRWAPEEDSNPTARYIRFIQDGTGISAKAEVDFTKREVLIPVAKYLTLFENGHPGHDQLLHGASEFWYDDDTYEKAFEKALKGRVVSHTMNEIVEEKPPLPEKKTWLALLLGIFGLSQSQAFLR